MIKCGGAGKLKSSLHITCLNLFSLDENLFFLALGLLVNRYKRTSPCKSKEPPKEEEQVCEKFFFRHGHVRIRAPSLWVIINQACHRQSSNNNPVSSEHSLILFTVASVARFFFSFFCFTI